MKKLREHVRRRLVQRAKSGSSRKTLPVTGTGRRWYKPYRDSLERERHEAKIARRLEQRRAEAWAKVETS